MCILKTEHIFLRNWSDFSVCEFINDLLPILLVIEISVGAAVKTADKKQTKNKISYLSSYIELLGPVIKFPFMLMPRLPT